VKPVAAPVLLLVVVAAGAWIVALRDVPAQGAAPDRAARVRGELMAYPGAENLVARRVVAGAGPHYWPSPDATRMAHQGYSGDLALLDLPSGESRLVTGDSMNWGRLPGTTPIAFASRFSPDGRYIAYEWSRDSTGDTVVLVRALRVLDLETGDVRELLDHEDPTSLNLGSWSPDGQAIVVVSRARYLPASGGRIALVRVRDGSTTEVAAFESRAPETAIFSPDGQWLAYHRVRDPTSGGHDIFFRSVDGLVERRLTRGPSNHQVAGWLPGGGPFFYLAGESDRFDLLAVAVEDGRAVSEPRVVRSDLWHIWPRGFSENAFFFAQRTERVQAFTAPIDPGAGRLTGPLTPIFPTTSTGRSASIAWSPDGDRFAFMDGSDLVVRSRATGAERRFRTGFRPNARLQWSPAKDQLAIWGYDSVASTGGVHVFELEDGSVELKVSAMEPRWSADGKALFVGRSPAAGPGYAVLQVDLATGEEAEVYRTEEYQDLVYAGFAPHPDGRHLAVGEQSPTPGEPDRVILIPLDGGESHELVRVDAPEGISYGPYGLAWTPDGRYLVISGNPDPEGRRKLWIVDRDGTELRELASLPSAGTAAVHSPEPRFHSGGRELSVIAGRNRFEIWTLENLRAEPLGGRGSVR
jgi:Tol biopolymer transport system component